MNRLVVTHIGSEVIDVNNPSHSAKLLQFFLSIRPEPYHDGFVPSEDYRIQSPCIDFNKIKPLPLPVKSSEGTQPSTPADHGALWNSVSNAGRWLRWGATPIMWTGQYMYSWYDW
jgi:hypothetical protein